MISQLDPTEQDNNKVQVGKTSYIRKSGKEREGLRSLNMDRKTKEEVDVEQRGSTIKKNAENKKRRHGKGEKY